jgi:hypothetical protein
MPEGMAARTFGDAAGADCVFDGVLEILFVDVMPAFLALAWIERQFFGGKNVLPGPLPGSPWIFSMNGARQTNGATATSEILSMKFFDATEVSLQWPNEPIGKDPNAFPQSFAFANGDLAIAEVYILNP